MAGGGLQDLPTITQRKSDKMAKSGEDMTEVLVDDIILYERFAEREEMLLLLNLKACNGSRGEDNFGVELQDLDICTRINEDYKNNSGNQRFETITMKETEQFIMENRNKSLITKLNVI